MSIVECKTLQIRTLPAGLQKIAECELNEVASRLVQDVKELREWVQRQPHLQSRISDQFLVSFLRGTKFNMEKAKKKLESFYTLRAQIPEIFNNRRLVSDPVVLDVVRLGVILQIPLASNDHGPCITIIRAGSYDTSKFKFADIVRVGTMFGEIMMMEDDNAAVSGYKEIMDMSNVSGTHFFQLKPDLLRKCSVYSDEAMPLRHRGIHFINVPGPFEIGFNTLKTIFPAKMTSRVTVSSDPEAIYNHVSRECLPQEYGGSNGSFKEIISRMEAKLLRYSDHFLEEQNYGAKESLRNAQNANNKPTWGNEGTFRKLDID